MQIRKAVIADVKDMQALINGYAQKELMLYRSLASLYENIRDFTLAVEGKKLLGTGALHVVWENLAEIRSVAVAPEYLHRGIGRQLVEALLAEARQLGISELFVLTYQPAFFSKCGFTVISKDQLPQKVWKDCVNCVKFPNCDEVALTLSLN
ncbi:MAG: N-acetyltransferase [Firmicutes bacterium]|nr:N-acetyltransferase [Bacillota bacterium]